ncbi:lipopolysaccharide kinase InaA family protein [Streptomyces sp. NPDC008150]|uniref:lipopolysaccharide kinase InaA family protein n=1 Tax=Streptomyces sp. NPDC008150 TaxID=3364816 RepID=UPI0036E923A7
MNVIPVSWARPEQLGSYRTELLGDGGQGVVFGVPSPPGRFHGMRMAYKEYKQGVRHDDDVLHDMCLFTERLGSADRAFLEERLTWPRALIYTGQAPTAQPASRNPGTRVAGFLMPRAGAEFELRSTRLGGAKAQGLEFLLNPDGYTRSLGLDVDDRQRLRLLADLASTLTRLHQEQVCVGDLSPKNILFTTGAAPRCLFIDCDSMRYRGRDVLDQVETTGWEVPETAKATWASDAWKFGLIAVRVVNRDQQQEDTAELRALSPGLADLAERCADPDPDRRPKMAEWLPALEHAVGHMKSRPRPAQPSSPAYAPTQQQWQQPRAPWQPQGQPQAPIPVWTPTPGPSGSSSGARVIGVLLTLLAIVVVGGFVFQHLPSGSSAGDTTQTSTGTDGGTVPFDSPESSAPEDEPASDNSATAADGTTVDYLPVVDNPEAAEIAGTFAEFFGAVNNRDWDSALTHYDPATKVVNLGSQSSREGWAEVMSTTTDSDFVLSEISESGRFTLATLNFTSNQAQGYGPADSPNDTCDTWTVTYQLTHTDGYRIFKAPREGVSYATC